MLFAFTFLVFWIIFDSVLVAALKYSAYIQHIENDI